MAITDISNITESSRWQDITTGNQIYGPGTSVAFQTGEWRTQTPVWNADKCKQCLLCVPVCPDSSIPVKNCERTDFDYDH